MGVPWMKPYFLSLVQQALDIVDADPGRLMHALRRAADELRQGHNPLDDGGIVALLATDEQRGVLAQVQALMSVLEGHGNAVMNHVGHEHVAGQERMARVLSRPAGAAAGCRACSSSCSASSRRCASTRSARRSSTPSSARAAPARSTRCGGARSRCRRSTSCARRRRGSPRRLSVRHLHLTSTAATAASPTVAAEPELATAPRNAWQWSSWSTTSLTSASSSASTSSRRATAW